jgi:hypothetical protein
MTLNETAKRIVLETAAECKVSVKEATAAVQQLLSEKLTEDNTEDYKAYLRLLKTEIALLSWPIRSNFDDLLEGIKEQIKNPPKPQPTTDPKPKQQSEIPIKTEISIFQFMNDLEKLTNDLKSEFGNNTNKKILRKRVFAHYWYVKNRRKLWNPERECKCYKQKSPEPKQATDTMVTLNQLKEFTTAK